MAKWTQNHRMEIGAVLLVIGLALTVISWSLAFADTAPGWLQGYNDLVRPAGGGEDYNLIVSIVGPVLLIWGGWYIGEQIIMRRRFEGLIDTPKRSEFSARRRELEETARRLPDGYRKRIKDKENEFVSKRA